MKQNTPRSSVTYVSYVHATFLASMIRCYANIKLFNFIAFITPLHYYISSLFRHGRLPIKVFWQFRFSAVLNKQPASNAIGSTVQYISGHMFPNLALYYSLLAQTAKAALRRLETPYPLLRLCTFRLVYGPVVLLRDHVKYRHCTIIRSTCLPYVSYDEMDMSCKTGFIRLVGPGISVRNTRLDNTLRN